MNKIILENVSKSFKGSTILENVNMELTSGHIYGIVGANGTGKSVLLQMICGLMWPTHGNIRFNQKLLHKELSVIPNCGIIINKPSFFNDLNGLQNLKLLASINKKVDEKGIIEILDRVGLNNTDKKVRDYSIGMIQRLGIAQAIMENQDILILDEFTNGLDEDGINMVHEILRNEKEKGKLILITSHNKYDINQLCDFVYKINKGTLIYESEN